MSVFNLIRPELLNAPLYITETTDTIFRMHANELPWNPLDSVPLNLNFYPDDQLQKQLLRKLANRYQVEINQITLTRGSDEGIDLITRLFLKAGENSLMQFPPTFSMYEFYTRLQGGKLIQCPLNAQDNFSLNLTAISAHWRSDCSIIMFCSPNNPTGNLMDLNLIAAVCKRYASQSIIVVDEAYIEFSAGQSATTLIKEFENLIVLRTLSKAAGLAGLRLGCIIANSSLINAINKIIPPYALSSSVIDLGIQALTNNEWFPAVIQTIQNSRSRLITELKKLPFFEKIYDSEGNFILVKTAYTTQISAWFKKHGIAIKEFSSSSLIPDHLRITISDDHRNQLVIATLVSFMNNFF